MKYILRCFTFNSIGAASKFDRKWFVVELSDFIVDIIAFTLNLHNNLVKRVLVRLYWFGIHRPFWFVLAL